MSRALHVCQRRVYLKKEGMLDFVKESVHQECIRRDNLQADRLAMKGIKADLPSIFCCFYRHEVIGGKLEQPSGFVLNLGRRACVGSTSFPRSVEGCIFAAELKQGRQCRQLATNSDFPRRR